MKTKERPNKITETIVGSAVNVYRASGRGLLASAFKSCMVFDLIQTGLGAGRQEPPPMVYREIELECCYRLNLMIKDEVIAGVKSAERIMPIHKAKFISKIVRLQSWFVN